MFVRWLTMLIILPASLAGQNVFLGPTAAPISRHNNYVNTKNICMQTNLESQVPDPDSTRLLLTETRLAKTVDWARRKEKDKNVWRAKYCLPRCLGFVVDKKRALDMKYRAEKYSNKLPSCVAVFDGGESDGASAGLFLGLVAGAVPLFQNSSCCFS